jgi:hypothetical protein
MSGSKGVSASFDLRSKTTDDPVRANLMKQLSGTIAFLKTKRK